MKTHIFFVLLTYFSVTNLFSQISLNNYKYIIVPDRYKFQNVDNEYKLNSLTTYFLKEYGFQVIKEGSKYPEDLIRNRCLALKTDVLHNSRFFKTKLTVVLKDCNNQIAFTTVEGVSLEKKLDKSYSEALYYAFQSLKSLNYKYTPKQENKKRNTATTKLLPIKQAIQGTKLNKDSVLHAQKIKDGYQLINVHDRIVYKIKKTSLNDVFLIEGYSAIIQKKLKDKWVMEYYLNNTLKQEILNIKF